MLTSIHVIEISVCKKYKKKIMVIDVSSMVFSGIRQGFLGK